MMRRSRWFVPLAWCAFLFSGMAGLIYEVVWARYLNLILGGTAYAHIMVLTAYMGGMAAGAWFFGRLADRLAEPLVVYTYLELTVGLYGLFFPTLFAAGSAVYLFLAGPLGTTGLTGVFNKLLVSVLLLGPSTFLMGGTLPLLTRACEERPDRVGARVAGLYFINSLGAVLGALLAGFVMVPGLGQSATLTTAAIINIFVGVGLLFAWRFGLLVRRPGTGEAAGPTPAPPVASPPFRELPDDPERAALWRRVAVWGAGLSGLLVMVYEVSWIRMLSTILGSSTYSFTLMLAAFISGIALGSLLARRLASTGRPFFWFGAAEVFMGLAMLLTIPLYERLPYGFLYLQSLIARTPAGYVLYEVTKYFFCLALMLLPTLASGAALPLATDVAARLQHGVGAPVGRVYAINSLGTILGALLGGLILLPLLGIRNTLQAAILVNVVFGFYVLLQHPIVPRRRLRTGAILTGLLFLLVVSVSPSWDQRAFAAGVFREHVPAGAVMKRYRSLTEGMRILFYEEDVNGTVAVIEQSGERSLVVNGKADASTWISDRTTQTLIPAIPMVIHPGAKDALVVGLGSGQSAGHLLDYGLDSVEVIEISPGVVRGSRFFDEMNGRPLEDPRTRLIMQDAKTYLLGRPDKQYDLIVSEPSNPWIAGIGGLFSREYFQMLDGHLRPGGSVAQWIHAYEQTDETLTTVFVTLSEVFPYVTLWQMSRSDLLLVGTREPVAWRFDEAAEAMRRPGVARGLQAIGVVDLYTLLGEQMMSPIRMAEVISTGGYLNTDDFPYLEYQAPRAFFLDAQAELAERYDERGRSLEASGLALADYLGGREPTSAELRHLLNFRAGLPGAAGRTVASVAARLYAADPSRVQTFSDALRAEVIPLIGAVAGARSLITANPDSLSALRMAADLGLQLYDRIHSVFYPAAGLSDWLDGTLADLAGRLPERDARYYRYRRGLLAYDRGAWEEALGRLEAVRISLGILAEPAELLRQVRNAALLTGSGEGEGSRSEALDALLGDMDPRMRATDVLTWIGRVHLRTGHALLARERFRDAYRLDPTNRVAAFYIVELDETLGSGRFFGPGG